LWEYEVRDRALALVNSEAFGLSFTSALVELEGLTAPTMI
jgi:hypothetical protein